MSRHNYTNPAFCQNSEFFVSPSQRKLQHQQPHNQHHASTYSINSNSSAFRIQRSESTRSFNFKRDGPLPPRPGPKPSGSRYALVPVEELADVDRDRYAIFPAKMPSERNLYDHVNRSDDTFTSLPPILHTPEQPKMRPAFSSDFGNSFVMMVDSKSNKRYAVVPQADDEDYVDDNQEIIQMHNGKAHRYAIIPTEEEETCLSNSDLNKPLQTSTPQKHYQSGTPIRNDAATKRLHELLSTPVKTPMKRAQSIPRNIHSTPKRYQSQQLYAENRASIHRKQELLPQRLQYERPPPPLPPMEKRTTAIISPRLANTSVHPEDLTSTTKDSSYPQKVVNASITLGVVSLILTVGSFLNSGLCLYMIAHSGRSFYLEFSSAAAFSGVGLGILGFKSRKCEWLPNRSYISGYVLVTVFCLLKCCGLLVLLALDPFPGFPLHDVTTGVILGLSTFKLVFIGLGVLGSFWCYRPPPDNRVNVY